MASFAADLYEGVSLAERLGVPRGALRYTNGSGQLRMPNSPSSVTAFTYAAWVRIQTDTNFYALWLSLQGASATYFEAGFALNGTSAIVNDLSNERSIGINFTVGSWYYFGISAGPSTTVKVYIGPEGGTLTEFSTTLTNLATPLSDRLLGGELAFEPLSGDMSEVRMWNATLTQAEHFAEFRSQVPVKSGVVGYWKLENATNKLVDSSGNSNTLSAPTGTGTWATAAGPNIGTDAAQIAEVYESWGLAEVLDVVHTPAGGTNYDANPSETVGLSESVAVSRGTTGSPAETVGLSDAISSLYNALVGPAETVGNSESVGASYGTAIGPTENVGLSEALGAVFAAIAGLAETDNLSEAISVSRGVAAALGETVSLSESVAALYSAIAALSDSISLSDAIAAARATSAALAETVTLAEAVIGGTAYTGNVSETVTLSESIARAYGAIVTVNETVALLEALQAALSAATSLGESVQWAGPAMAERPSSYLHLVAEDWQPGQSWTSRLGGWVATLTGSLQKQTANAIERNEITGFGSSNHFVLPANAAHEFTPTLQRTWEFLIRSTGSPSGGILLGRFTAPFAGAFDVAQFGAGVLLGAINTAGDDYYRLLVGDAPFSAGYYHVTFVLDSVADTLTSYVNGVFDAVATGHTSTLINSTPADFWIGNSNGNDQPYDGGLIEVLVHNEALSAQTIASRYAINRVAAQLGANPSVAETVAIAESAGISAQHVVFVSDLLTLAESLNVTVPIGVVQALIAALRERSYSVSLIERAYRCAARVDLITPFVGTTVEFEGTFRNPRGVLYTPASPSLTIKKPDGTSTVLTGGSLTVASTGVLRALVLLDQPGVNTYEWKDNGIVVQGEKIVVQPSVLD